MEYKSIWWEKTVEYKFILDAERNIGLQFAAPLSGIQERAGDGVFSSDSRIVLIEFKRTQNDLDTEHNKFKNYEEAAREMTGSDTHHFLVYGSHEKSDEELCLHACNYFSRNKIDTVLNILNNGVESSVFQEYLTKLVEFKKVDERSSGTVAPESVASAIGVSSKGVSAISLSDYYRIAIPHLYQKLSPSQNYQPSTLNFG